MSNPGHVTPPRIASLARSALAWHGLPADATLHSFDGLYWLDDNDANETLQHWLAQEQA